jgi:hypothetical protein
LSEEIAQANPEIDPNESSQQVGSIVNLEHSRISMQKKICVMNS